LYYRESEGDIVIVSEPFDHDENWITVPENHVVVAKAGERARMLPLFRHQQQAAE
jgi:glutamine amidotransferase